MSRESEPPVLYTVGHSTRTAEEFLALLEAHWVEGVVDVRRYPASRRHPHFGAEPIAAALEGVGIAYRHEPALGGRRSGRADSPNTAWRSAGFRAYADHMASETFGEGLERLARDARVRRTAILCAEAVPWRCHRQLVADALTLRGWSVRHILGPGAARPHEPNEHARLREDGTVVYPAPEDDQLEIL